MVVFGAVPFAGFILHNSMLSNSRRVLSALFRRVIEMYPMLVYAGSDSFVVKGFSISSIVVLVMQDVARISIAAVARIARVVRVAD